MSASSNEDPPPNKVYIRGLTPAPCYSPVNRLSGTFRNLDFTVQDCTQHSDLSQSDPDQSESDTDQSELDPDQEEDNSSIKLSFQSQSDSGEGSSEPPENDVTTGLPDDDVITGLPDDNIITGLPDDDVITGLPDDNIITREDDVITGLPDDDVITPLGDVMRVLPDDNVITPMGNVMRDSPPQERLPLRKSRSYSHEARRSGVPDYRLSSVSVLTTDTSVFIRGLSRENVSDKNLYSLAPKHVTETTHKTVSRRRCTRCGHVNSQDPRGRRSDVILLLFLLLSGSVFVYRLAVLTELSAAVSLSSVEVALVLTLYEVCRAASIFLLLLSKCLRTNFRLPVSGVGLSVCCLLLATPRLVPGYTAHSAPTRPPEVQPNTGDVINDRYLRHINLSSNINNSGDVRIKDAPTPSTFAYLGSLTKDDVLHSPGYHGNIDLASSVEFVTSALVSEDRNRTLETMTSSSNNTAYIVTLLLLLLSSSVHGVVDAIIRSVKWKTCICEGRHYGLFTYLHTAVYSAPAACGLAAGYVLATVCMAVDDPFTDDVDSASLWWLGPVLLTLCSIAATLVVVSLERGVKLAEGSDTVEEEEEEEGGDTGYFMKDSGKESKSTEYWEKQGQLKDNCAFF